MTPFVWRDGEPIALTELSQCLSASQCLSELQSSSERSATAPLIEGHFAGLAGDWLVRDPLGVQKLFFALRDGELVWRHHAIDLVREGTPLEHVWSVPSGAALRIDASAGRLQREALDAPPAELTPGDWTECIPAIRESLHETFRRLAIALEGRPVFVTLSGGLDSSGIAALAKRYVPHVRAVTFHVVEDGETSDVRSARRVAEHLGIPLELVACPREEVLAGIDTAIVDGQDHRDFNLHCALVNQVLARGIAERARDAVVLTGDGMNELLCDYAPVQYRGQTFYALPSLPPAELRRVLVRGLDAGDREVGIFARRGLDTIQPYLLCARAYLRLPVEILGSDGGKAQLARAVFGSEIPESVYVRPKVRAQVAEQDGARGTLAAVVDAGLSGAALERRAAALYGCTTQVLRGWIRGGRYRFPARFEQLAISPQT